MAPQVDAIQRVAAQNARIDLDIVTMMPRNIPLAADGGQRDHEPPPPKRRVSQTRETN